MEPDVCDAGAHKRYHSPLFVVALTDFFVVLIVASAIDSSGGSSGLAVRTTVAFAHLNQHLRRRA